LHVESTKQEVGQTVERIRSGDAEISVTVERTNGAIVNERKASRSLDRNVKEITGPWTMKIGYGKDNGSSWKILYSSATSNVGGTVYGIAEHFVPFELNPKGEDSQWVS
jgi:hypothetical protein